MKKIYVRYISAAIAWISLVLMLFFSLEYFNSSVSAEVLKTRLFLSTVIYFIAAAGAEILKTPSIDNK